MDRIVHKFDLLKYQRLKMKDSVQNIRFEGTQEHMFDFLLDHHNKELDSGRHKDYCQDYQIGYFHK